MSILPLNIGSAPNDGNGQDLRSGGQVINANFAELDQRTTAAQSAAQAAQATADAAIPGAQKGQPNGVAGLDGSGTVPASQLPSYVDDVLEFASFAALPAVGETGKIYITIDTNSQYRWSGSQYVLLTASPGSTDAVPEGAINKYWTLARTLGSVLAGLVTTSPAVIAATDTVLSAFGKLQRQITDLSSAVTGKAGKGSNSDITEITGLTTPLAVSQGGTGGATPAQARTALGLKSASIAEVMTSLMDATEGRVMLVGAFGTGGTSGLRLPGYDANAVLPNGNYWTPAVWTGSPYAGTDSKNQGFLETRTWSTSGDAIQVWRGIIPAYGSFTRFKTEGVWGSWTNSSAADIAFTYVYPNGGSAASPASVSIGSRYASPNPFPGFPIICHVELLISGVWETPGWFSNGQSGGSGTLSTPRRGGAVDEIITATGGAGVASGSSFGGGSYNSSTLTSAPARIKVWRVKG